MITLDEFHMMKYDLNYNKRRIIHEIKKLVKPYLHGSEYIRNHKLPKNNPKRYIQLATFGSYGERSYREGEARDYRKGDFTIEGFTQDGIISDSYCAIATCTYIAMDIDHLWWTYQIAIKHHKKLV